MEMCGIQPQEHMGYAQWQKKRRGIIQIRRKMAHLRYRHFWHNHFAAQLADLSTRLRTRFQLMGEFASLETDGTIFLAG